MLQYLSQEDELVHSPDMCIDISYRDQSGTQACCVQTKDQEMQRKKERLIQQQLRRKEQQEQKRQEKETEMARKLEQKM